MAATRTPVNYGQSSSAVTTVRRLPYISGQKLLQHSPHSSLMQGEHGGLKSRERMLRYSSIQSTSVVSSPTLQASTAVEAQLSKHLPLFGPYRYPTRRLPPITEFLLVNGNVEKQMKSARTSRTCADQSEIHQPLTVL